MLTAILLLIAFVAGFYIGSEYPSALAKAKADLHAAEAEATRAATKLQQMRSGL